MGSREACVSIRKLGGGERDAKSAASMDILGLNTTTRESGSHSKPDRRRNAEWIVPLTADPFSVRSRPRKRVLEGEVSGFA